MAVQKVLNEEKKKKSHGQNSQTQTLRLHNTITQPIELGLYLTLITRPTTPIPPPRKLFFFFLHFKMFFESKFRKGKKKLIMMMVYYRAVSTHVDNPGPG